ncbi:HNH endonuclease signature motif containing protein [Actinomadura sp. NPDC048021]|uniref:HNH endonuclease n=1 Tax=Actinomadura sp. NPDC048021 TaxID=3155385 RepID=UPI0033F54CFE
MHRAPKLCARCNNVATGGAYCDDCRPKPFAGARERWKANQPGNWATLRKKVIRRAKGLCEIDDCTEPGTEVDHINPVAEHGLWTLDNLRLLCKMHNQDKAQEEARRGRERSRKLRKTR